MRFSLERVAAALLPAVLLAGSARAQDFSFLRPVAATSNDSYYSQYYAQAPQQGNFLTGAEQDSSPSDVTMAPSVGSHCDSCYDCDYDYCDVGSWWDNTLFSLGGEAYKSIGDTTTPPGLGTGFMDSAGLVGTFNTGFALGSLENIRGQIGASYGVYDFKGRDTITGGGTPAPNNSAAEQQVFLTLGVYKRSQVLYGDRISWGLVYDQFWAHQWGLLAGQLYVGQVRGIVGYATSEWNEFGVWGAFNATSDNSVSPSLTPPPIRAMNQYNVFWRHNYQFGGQSLLYVGGNDPADVGSWLFGFLGQAPLSDYLGLYGNFVYSLPGSAAGPVGSNEEEWAFGAGLTWYIGGKAVSPTVSGRRGLPLLPVASNQWFLLTN